MEYRFESNSNTSAQASDFEGPINGTINFAPGQSTATIALQIKGDTNFEQNESFKVRLSDAKGAEILESTATSTILNDDPSAIIFLSLFVGI